MEDTLVDEKESRVTARLSTELYPEIRQRQRNTNHVIDAEHVRDANYLTDTESIQVADIMIDDDIADSTELKQRMIPNIRVITDDTGVENGAYTVDVEDIQEEDSERHDAFNKPVLRNKTTNPAIRSN